MLPWVHPSPNPKRHLDRFSRFCTAHGRVTILHNRPPLFALKIVPSHGDLNSNLIHGSLGPPESSTETAFWLVLPFFAQLTAEFPILYNGSHFPLKIAPPNESGPHLIHGSLAPVSPQPKWHLSPMQMENFTAKDMPTHAWRHFAVSCAKWLNQLRCCYGFLVTVTITVRSPFSYSYY